MEQPQIDDRIDLTKQQDLQFCGMAIAQARRDFDPGTPIFITWGLICLIGYTGTHFLVTGRQYNYINPMWWSLLATGFFASFYFGCRMLRQQRAKGFISHIDRQIGWVWCILVFNGMLWSMLGYFKDFFGGPGLYWAFVYSLALSITGIIYAKEWLAGGVIILAGMVIAHFTRSCPYIILGIAMAAGCIIPSIISRRRLKKMERNNGTGKI